MTAAALLPPDIRASALAMPEGEADAAEEFRLRAGRRPTVLLPEGERPLARRAVSPAELESVLEAATGASAHTALEAVQAGFASARGGVRLGLAGTASESGGKVLAIRRLGSVALRIPHEAIGCADVIFPELTAQGFKDTLIISPPGGGKTTLLRELVRKLASSLRVSLIDERGEVAAAASGTPEFDVGERTDVLTGADKRSGVDMLLRAMNPQVLAMDEISAEADAEAAEAATGCGVKLLATAHAADVDELGRRAVYRRLLDAGVFSRAVVIGRCGRSRRFTVKELRP